LLYEPHRSRPYQQTYSTAKAVDGNTLSDLSSDTSSNDDDVVLGTNPVLARCRTSSSSSKDSTGLLPRRIWHVDKNVTKDEPTSQAAAAASLERSCGRSYSNEE
jgi:hypothetical protein